MITQLADMSDLSHREWIEKRTGIALSQHARAVEAVTEKGAIKGMVAFDCWAPNSVQAHMAVDTPIAWRALIRAACTYPFKVCGKGVVVGAIAADNLASLRTAEHIGFRLVSKIRDGYSLGVDLIILELRPETCRYLESA